MTTSEPDPRMAVIGMAFRLPGGDTPEEFWRVVRDGTDCIRRFTEDELAAAGVPAEEYRAADFVGASGVLDDIAGFDAQHFAMSAREARLTDPQHRMFLECAQHALENAGYPDERDGTRVGVYASTGYHLYTLQNYLLNNVLPSAAPSDWMAGMQITVGNHADFTATRVAYRLGLTGPAVNLQTGCSSSLVGVQSAAQSLLMGDCDIALVGATAVHVPQVLGYRYVKGSILSKSGRLRAFDAGADGTVGGTGVLAVVLKRLARAVTDGDTIHGVVRGWGISNDGADKTAFAAPSARGQRAAIRQALRRAGVGADTIGYLETHGTGTLKGDPIEFDGATGAYREDTDRTGYCALGSTKANIGHLDAASGLAGLVKALLVLKHGVIPPMANFSEPNPGLDLDHSPFYIPRTARPWPESDVPRRAGVTSLGVGGTNVHLILEQAPDPASRTDAAAPPDVLLVSASSEDALADNARAFRDRLRQPPAPHLSGPRHHRCPGPRSRPPPARGPQQHPGRPRRRPRRLARRNRGGDGHHGDKTAGGPRARRVPVHRAGQPVPGDGRPPLRTFPRCTRGARRLRAPLPRPHRRLTAVRPACGRRTGGGADGGAADREGRGEEEPSWGTDTAQPALFALQCALARLWRDTGIEPCVVTGHSVGEYAALYAAGALSLDDGLRLTIERGRLMQQRCAPGAMVAATLDRESALALAAEVPGLEVAVTNGARAQVLAGTVEAVDRACTLLEERGTPGQRLTVTRAFHTALMEPMLEELRKVLDDVTFRPVRIPFVSALDGVTRPPGWTPDADYFLRHTREPVRFDEALRGIGAQQPDVLLEIGPHTTLSGLARRALPAVPVAAVPAARHRARLPLGCGRGAALCGGGRRLAGAAGRQRRSARPAARIPIPAQAPLDRARVDGPQHRNTSKKGSRSGSARGSGRARTPQHRRGDGPAPRRGSVGDRRLTRPSSTSAPTRCR